MTAEATKVATGELWTLDDLKRLWKPPASDMTGLEGEALRLALERESRAQRKWLWRRIHAWCVPNDGDRYDPRFIPSEVLRCTERHLGRARR